MLQLETKLTHSGDQIQGEK